MKRFKIRSLMISWKKTGEKISRFVGMYTSPRPADYLTLYSLKHGVGKSDLVREVLNKWYKWKIQEEPIEELVNTLKSRLQHEWDSKKNISDFSETSGGENQAFKDYIQDIKNTLSKKGLSDVFISSIINSIRK